MEGNHISQVWLCGWYNSLSRCKICSWCCHPVSNLDKMPKWKQQFCIEFHPEKFNVTFISRRQNPIAYYFTLHNHMLEHVTSTKHLGITIKYNLNWDTHTTNTITKANKMLGFIRRNLRIRSTYVKEKESKLLMRSLVEHTAPFRTHALSLRQIK